MDKRRNAFRAVVFLTCSGLLWCGVVFAQTKARTPMGPATKGTGALPGKDGKTAVDAGTILKLQKLNGLARRGFVKTPEYNTSFGRQLGLEKDWCQISLSYMTGPEWIDDLSFQFYAVSEAMIEGKKTFSFYKAAVRYSDIERGQHICTMYLRPSAVKRFGELFAIAVEVSYKGEVIAKLSVEEQKLGEDWWKNPTVLENPALVVRDGYLIPRSMSPFALLTGEGYEFSR